MLTNISLKVEIVKNNNKFHENDFRNIINPLKPKSKMVRHIIEILQ